MYSKLIILNKTLHFEWESNHTIIEKYYKSYTVSSVHEQLYLLQLWHVIYYH